MRAKWQPPAIDGYRMRPNTPLHQLACKRMQRGRDLKIIITAKDSQTGVGKTTLATWLALSWTKLFAGHDWHVEKDEWGAGMGTLRPKEYFRMVSKIPNEYGAGTVVVVDDAEELDARRSMQNLNVEFSQRWMLMRLKQAITIITLPSPKAIDSRLEELADVWINVERRGRGIVHDIRVNSYGSRNVMTQKKHKLTFPNISDHPESEALRELKEQKMDDWDTQKEEEDEEVDPKEVKKAEKKRIAQQARDTGMTCKDAANLVGMSAGWVSNHTETREAAD